MDVREPSPRTGSEPADETLTDDPLRPAPHRRLERGDTLGRYVVVGHLGEGAMGLVYTAYDPELDRRVALKLLRPGMGPPRGSVHARRLVREAQAMAKLAHPNVVTVHDVGTHGDRVFLAMEYVEGTTLAAWLATEPTTGEVLEVFAAAGRGLAAAHDKGLVHRDFKPDNVMIGHDGRVLVMDFGLARADEPSESEPGPSSERSPKELSSRITQTGTRMGTPAYMAPEQHLGGTVDARSDQFAFCVTLYEGLYGIRPFAGETLAAVGMSIIEGRIEEPPPGRTVPRWLQQVVLRGLSTDPDQRYPDMHALLHALQADPRRWRGLGLGAVGATAVAAALWLPDEPDERCRDAADHLVGVWDAPRRERIAAAMRSTHSPVATDTVERITERLDRYTQGWVTMRNASCAATRVRGEQSEALMDLRHACLDQRLGAAAQMLDVFEHADADVVQRAVASVATLPPLSECADVVALRRGLPPPRDPPTATAVAALREQLGRIPVLARTGRYDEGRRLAVQLREEASALGYLPVLAEAHAAEGELRSEAGEHERAVEALSQAYFLAMRVRHDEVAARTAALLTYEVGYRLARHEPGFAWGQHALSLGLRVGEGGLPEADAHHYFGVLANAAGDTELAAIHHQRAHALRVQLLDADHPDRARSLNALGNVHLGRGEYEQALVDYRASLSLRERVFGPHHPEVASALNNVSLVLRDQGDYEGARAALERAVEIYASVHGPEHAQVAQARNNLGLVLRDRGDAIAAEAEHRKALAIRERVLGPTHPDLGDSLVGVGRALSLRGLHTEAEPPLRRALALYERAFGPDHPAVADASIGLGVAQLGLGRAAEAVSSAERALAILDARAPDTRERAEAAALLERARAQLGPELPADAPAPVDAEPPRATASLSPAGAAPSPPGGSPLPPPAPGRPPAPGE